MMHKIMLPIDTKSLYYNILNDNLNGHTCTVATPIKQGNSLNIFLNEVYKIPKQIDFEKSSALIKDLTKNSKSSVRINNVFVFDKIKINGAKIDLDCCYCFYVKEEIDKNRAQFGRIKLHYPLNLINDEFNINNRKVINKISEYFHGYAFLVEGFEYNFEDDSLNFVVLLIGYNNIPYSKVFINNKGVGSKYNKAIKNYFDVYDTEIISLRKKFGYDISVESFPQYIEKGKSEAKEIVKKHLLNVGFEKIEDASEDYPYSLYDFRIKSNENIIYCIVEFTFTKCKYFSLSYYQNNFVNSFNNVLIALVTDVCGTNKVSIIERKELKEFSVGIDSVRFVGGNL